MASRAVAPRLRIDRLFLHATPMGRPLYQSLGWRVDDGLLQLDLER